MKSGAVVRAIETARVTLDADPELTVHGAKGAHARSNFLLVRVVVDDGGREVVGYGEVSATPLWSGEGVANQAGHEPIDWSAPFRGISDRVPADPYGAAPAGDGRCDGLANEVGGGRAGTVRCEDVVPTARRKLTGPSSPD